MAGALTRHQRPIHRQAFCRIALLATPAIAETARTEAIYQGEKFSDQAPITVEYELAL